MLHAASTGATGCEMLASDVECCALDLQSSGECLSGGSAGVCTDTDACTEASGTATPSSNSTTGCESLPENVQCCVFPLQRDEPTQPSSSAPTAVTMTLLATVCALAPLLL